MNRAAHVFFSVTDESMIETFTAKVIVSAVFIGIDVCAFLDRGPDDFIHWLQPLLRNYLSANLAVPSVFPAFK